MIAQALNVQRLVEEERRRLRRREHAPAAGARRALRLLEHHRHQRTDAADVRAGGAGRQDQHHGADSRRVRHRQGADRARHPLQLAAREEAVRQGQLRGAARHADRVGALRLREGRVHRRGRPQEGPLRDGRGRHALSRRDRRHQPRHAGQAAARAAGARVRAPRRHRHRESQRPADRRDEQGPGEGDRGRQVPRGPVLPPQRVHDLRAAAARAEGRPAAAGRSLPREVLARARQGDQAHLDAGHRHADGLSLARQRPRARERHRAGRPRLRRGRNPRPSPAAVAPDRRRVRHGDAGVAQGCGGRLRAGPHPGRAQDDPRQPREGGAAARHDRADPQLQGAGYGIDARRFKSPELGKRVAVPSES